MKTRDEFIAKRLSEITGRKVSDFYDANISNKSREYADKYGGEIKDSGYIIGGRQITSREYSSIVRGMTQNELLYHPMLYKLFRAENQKESNFIQWINKFKED